MSFFPGHFERTKCLKTYENNFQAIIFLIIFVSEGKFQWAPMRFPECSKFPQILFTTKLKWVGRERGSNSFEPDSCNPVKIRLQSSQRPVKSCILRVWVQGILSQACKGKRSDQPPHRQRTPTQNAPNLLLLELFVVVPRNSMGKSPKP